jgi:hypothetical protein
VAATLKKLFLEQQTWRNGKAEVLFVLFFTGKGTLKVPKCNRNSNSKSYGVPYGLEAFSHDKNSCLIIDGNTSRFLKNGRAFLKINGYCLAEEVPNY